MRPQRPQHSWGPATLGSGTRGSATRGSATRGSATVIAKNEHERARGYQRPQHSWGPGTVLMPHPHQGPGVYRRAQKRRGADHAVDDHAALLHTDDPPSLVAPVASAMPAAPRSSAVGPHAFTPAPAVHEEPLGGLQMLGAALRVVVVILGLLTLGLVVVVAKDFLTTSGLSD